MFRFLVGMMALFGWAAPSWASSYHGMSLPKLVARADVIVVGTVADAGNPCRVTVTRTLAGTAGKEIEFPRHPDTFLKAGDARVLFLTSGMKGLALVYPLATLAAEKADAVAMLVAMWIDPAKYLADATVADTTDFLETLGWAFEKREVIGSLDRKTVAGHLVRSLGSREPKAVATAVIALQRIGTKNAAAVVPLIGHQNVVVQIAAIEYFMWVPDKTAVAPLCEVLDEIKVLKDKAYSPLEAPVGRALMAIGDSAAVPALQRAAGRGVYGATSWALGRLGDKKSCEVLMSGVEADAMDALEGMMMMVRRSNQKFEPWMAVNQWSEATGLKHKVEWRKWWAANRDSFELVKTVEKRSR